MTEKAALILRFSTTEPSLGRPVRDEVRAAQRAAGDMGLSLVGLVVAKEPPGGNPRNLREFLGLVRETPSVAVILSSRLDRVARTPEETALLVEVLEEEDRNLILFQTGLRADREGTTSIRGSHGVHLIPEFVALAQARQKLRARG